MTWPLWCSVSWWGGYFDVVQYSTGSTEAPVALTYLPLGHEADGFYALKIDRPREAA